jgi:hypothetical protein
MAIGAAGYGDFRASDADREQVIGALKTAFVQGRLSQDEFGLRAGQALAARTHAELGALTAGLAAARIEVRPSRKPVSKKAVAWGACAVVLPPVVWAAFLTYYGGFLVMILLAFLGVVATSGPPAHRGARR